MTQNTALQDPVEMSPVFIHSALDDYGLTPAQFRVYAHIARRAGNLEGVCYAAVNSIAKACGINPKTVRLSLKFLVRRCLLRQEVRPGETTHYRLTPVSQWERPPLPVQQNTHTDSTLAEREGCPPERIQERAVKGVEDHPSTHLVAKGTPLEGDPREGSTHKGNPYDYPEELIFHAYPFRVGKKAAMASIHKALKSYPADFLLERTKLYAEARNGDVNYCPHPAKWFEQERFNDDPRAWKRTVEGPPGSIAGAPKLPPVGVFTVSDRITF